MDRDRQRDGAQERVGMKGAERERKRERERERAWREDTALRGLLKDEESR